MDEAFAPRLAPTVVHTLAAAQARIAAVRPAAYARTRNALDGAVSQLSPYITHGFVTLAEVLAGVAKRHARGVQHKFVYELGWRAYFRHVWQHRGDGILQSLREGPLPDAAYARELPADIRQACTGVPVVDEAIRTLYATGMLHNHARMWLASYVVHLRKVHWRTGADWLYVHLLDGDLASNHLSWQWVAGTGSSKPYLFNADNGCCCGRRPRRLAGASLEPGRTAAIVTRRHAGHRRLRGRLPLRLAVERTALALRRQPHGRTGFAVLARGRRLHWRCIEERPQGAQHRRTPLGALLGALGRVRDHARTLPARRSSLRFLLAMVDSRHARAELSRRPIAVTLPPRFGVYRHLSASSEVV
ncbi:MAG: hypothetical protein NVS9B2_15880 [Steroidobacteraceae bacterium]